MISHLDELGKFIVPSGWRMPPLWSHPDEKADIDFLQHTVALQHFQYAYVLIVCGNKVGSVCA